MPSLLEAERYRGKGGVQREFPKKKRDQSSPVGRRSSEDRSKAAGGEKQWRLYVIGGKIIGGRGLALIGV